RRLAIRSRLPSECGTDRCVAVGTWLFAVGRLRAAARGARRWRRRARRDRGGQQDEQRAGQVLLQRHLWWRRLFDERELPEREDAGLSVPGRWRSGGLQVTNVLLHVLLTLAAIIVLGRVLGRLLEPLGQPQVIADILAGILLGPSLIGTHAA